MSGITTIEEARLSAAADWWLRLREPEVSEATLLQWIAWSAREENLAAFERLGALADDMEHLDDASRDVLRRGLPSPQRAKKSARPWLPLALAAGFAAAATGGYLAWTLLTATVARDYASEVAQRQDVRLPDGTQVVLGGASRIAARFDSNLRKVELSEGEAFFQIAPDDMPFEVRVGEVRIRDVGTSFDVRRGGDRVMIEVAEGRVMVNAPGAVSVQEATAGQRIVFVPGAGLQIVQSDPARTAAWREHRLEFDNEPLDVVVASLNRYSKRPVRIADAKLAALAFTGTIRTDAIDRWLEALPQVLPLRVDMRPTEVVLSSREPVARQ
ncbi:FecR family protein [Dyella sp. 2RAB6]|uniref:FecR family protein n=1 Tax=Dyella sp. 2RAB6 TaxID=3232992 RepID=UPI003F8F5E51